MGWARVPDVRAARPRLRGRFLAVPPALTIRPLEVADLDWAEAFLVETLGGRLQARRGDLVDVLEGGARNGAVAELDGRPVGLVTWFTGREGPSGDAPGAAGPRAEVRAVAVEAGTRGRGAGRLLLQAAEQALRDEGVGRAWLVTTNDNLAALALYQKAGWHLSALRVGAIDDARGSIKPSLPEIGQHGIPLRDELQLEKALQDPDA